MESKMKFKIGTLIAIVIGVFTVAIIPLIIFTNYIKDKEQYDDYINSNINNGVTLSDTGVVYRGDEINITDDMTLVANYFSNTYGTNGNIHMQEGDGTGEPCNICKVNNVDRFYFVTYNGTVKNFIVKDGRVIEIFNQIEGV